MDKTLFTLFILSLSIVSLQAQKQEFQFGHVSNEELKMTTYDKDPEAEAVILYDKGKSSFRIDREKNQLNIIYKRTSRIKIFKKSALDRSNIKIYFYKGGYNRNQKIYDIRAQSYNMDESGFQKSEVNAKDIYEEKIDDELFVKKFAIPNVKIGTVIEFEYTIEIPNSNNIIDWEFQSDLPTVYSEYEVSLVPFFEYTYLMQGKSRFDWTTSYEGKFTRTFASVEFEDMNYRFAMKGLPAFKDETFITSKNDYIIKMDWQLTKIHYPDGRTKEFMSTWPQISNELLKSEYFGKFVKDAQRSAKKKLPEMVPLEGLSKFDQAKAITDYVKSNFKWNGLYRKYTDISFKEFLKAKEGNSTEINLYLLGLLRTAGIEADAVLISTRGHGKVDLNFPTTGFFNTSIVLVKIDDKYFKVDGTESLLPFGWLPSECINEKGLIITKDSQSWIDLSAEPTSIVQEIMILKLDPEEGLVLGQFKKSMTGYDAVLHKKNPERLKSELEDYELQGEVAETNENDYNRPLVIDYEAEAPGIDVYGDMINLKPFLNKPWGSNPLKARRRNYPVDLIYKRQREYISTIHIPEGYEVVSLPEAKKLEDDLVKVSYEIGRSDNTLRVSANYTFKKSVYKPNEYTRIRNHINLFIEKFNEYIIFKRKP